MQPEQKTTRSAGDIFGKMLAEQSGTSDALKTISEAKHRADARAARLLAERECPPNLREWGRIHGIPTFAEFTWQAGFLAGMRAAMLPEDASDAG